MPQIVLGILASTRGTDLQVLIDAIETGALDARIACVMSNKADAFALERARKHCIEAIFLDPKKFASKKDYDSEIVRLLNERNVQLVLLIGYNKFLTEPFLDAFRNRAMNIHPSLLPAFKGWSEAVHRQVLDSGVKETGATLFFIDEDPDGGPIICQKAVPVLEGDSVDSLKQRVQKAEQAALLEGIGLFQQGRLVLEGKRVRVAPK